MGECAATVPSAGNITLKYRGCGFADVIGIRDAVYGRAA